EVELLIESLSHEVFDELAEALLGDLTDEELEHYGILGMKWGVRKDRRTGKRVGKPVKGTEAASHDTPSLSPKARSAKTASPDGAVAIKAGKTGRTVAANLDQKQKSKLGYKGPDFSDMSTKQLKEMSERLKIEGELSKILDGPDKYEAMQVVVNRIKLEQEFKRLTALPPTKRQVVAKKAIEILKSVGEQQLKIFLNKQVSDWLGTQ